MYNLELPFSRKTYFDYYEKTLTEEKWEELIENKVILLEKPNETEDIILSDKEIIEKNILIEDYKNFIPTVEYFYNLTVVNNLYGEDFIVEIVYYVLQRYLRNIIDLIEDHQKKNERRKLHVDVNLLKQMDLYAAEIESDNVLFEAKKQFTKKGVKKKHGINKHCCRSSNCKTTHYEFYGDDDVFYYDTEEELKEICVAFMKEWFVYVIDIDCYDEIVFPLSPI